MIWEIEFPGAVAMKGEWGVAAMDWRDLWAISLIHLAPGKGDRGVRVAMDGSPTRGEENEAWRKAESAACGREAVLAQPCTICLCERLH
jgi:hypothetical protein